MEPASLLGLDLLASSSGDVTTAIAALRAEWDDPPDRFRDPITLGLMSEPMVLSSGHHFDKATLYDEHGRLRFDRCPMTRAHVEPMAYPLLCRHARGQTTRHPPQQ